MTAATRRLARAETVHSDEQAWMVFLIEAGYTFERYNPSPYAGDEDDFREIWYRKGNVRVVIVDAAAAEIEIHHVGAGMSLKLIATPVAVVRATLTAAEKIAN